MNYKDIIIGVLIITILLLVYYSLPQEGAESNDLAMKETCREVGLEAHQDIVDDYNSDDPDSTLLMPEYTYNKELETCLYTSGSISTVDGKIVVQKWLTDSFTNETIYFHSSVDSERVVGLSSDEFQRQKEILFE